MATFFSFLLQLTSKIRTLRLNNYSLNVIILSSVLFFVIAQSTVLTIDRSRSFFVLSWVESSKISFTSKAIDLSLVTSNEKYSTSAIELRLQEQIDRKLIYTNSQSYELTALGRLVLFSANSFAKLFNLTGWYNNNG